jgi:hypothetical protein
LFYQINNIDEFRSAGRTTDSIAGCISTTASGGFATAIGIIVRGIRGAVRRRQSRSKHNSVASIRPLHEFEIHSFQVLLHADRFFQ